MPELVADVIIALLASSDALRGGAGAVLLRGIASVRRAAIAAAVSMVATLPLPASVAAATPTNDDFANAATISGASGSLSGSNFEATLEGGEVACGGGNSTVWFKWTAPGPGRAHFSTQGSDFDSAIGLFTPDRTLIDCGTYVYPSDYGFVAWDVTDGATYYVAVGGEGGATGTYVLTWDLPDPQPTNDDFADAVQIDGVQAHLPGTTALATKENHEPDHAGYAGGSSVWYVWTAPQTGTGKIFVSSSVPLVVAVYSGNSLNGLTERARDATAEDGWLVATFPITAGAEYRIAVDRKTATSGAFTVWWRSPPLNDDFTHAQLITGTSGTVTGVTDAATWEPGEPAHGAYPATASIWYRWTAPVSGPAALDTNGSEWGWRASLAVYTGSSLASLTRVAAQRVRPRSTVQPRRLPGCEWNDLQDRRRSRRGLQR